MKTTTAGPLKKLPIVLKRPFIKVLPFSGSKALSKNSVNLVVKLNKFSKRGPNVIDPILSANEVNQQLKHLFEQLYFYLILHFFGKLHLWL